MILLETLPGWPAAPEVSMLHMLLLTVIGPFAVGAIITLLVLGPKGLRRHAAGAEVARRDTDS